MRSLFPELARSSPVVATVLCLSAVFPYGALFFTPSPDVDSSRSPAAFVSLTPDREEAAVRAAKTAWLDGSGIRDRMTAALSIGDLPVSERGSALGDGAVLPPVSGMPLSRWRKRPYFPSLAAEKPSSIAVIRLETATPAFSRKELLSLETKGTEK